MQQHPTALATATALALATAAALGTALAAALAATAALTAYGPRCGQHEGAAVAHAAASVVGPGIYRQLEAREP